MACITRKVKKSGKCRRVGSARPYGMRGEYVVKDGRREGGRKRKMARGEEETGNECNGDGRLCECINSAIKWAHLRTSHITAICLVVNLTTAGGVDGRP